ADAELNRLWTKLIADARKCDKSPDCGRTASDQRSEEGILKQGQRAWVQFRDAQCEYEGLGERGGSMEPMIVNACRERLTRERIKQLSAGEK
ncbi:MAG TPA: lysozyme inhibitor LprI family protein, partial [Sphingomicrobium sp.]